VGLAVFVGVWALIAGILAGALTHLILSYYYAPYRPQLQFNWKAAQPLIHFGRWIFLTSLVAVSGSAMLQWVIARRLGAGELGLYYLAASIAFIPAEISGEVVGAVLFPLVARWQDNARRVVGVFRSVIAGISALILPLCGLLIALAPALVDNLLGEKWQGTAPLIQLLAIVNVLGLLGDTIVPILQGMGKPYQVTVLEVVQSTLLIGLIWGLANRFGVNGAALAWIIAIGVSQLFSAWFVRQLLPRPFATLGKPLLSVGIITIVGMWLAYQINNLSPNLIGFFLAGSVATGTMALSIWWADKQFSMGIVANFYQLMPAKINQKH
jgi:O-antigen/teichoic acid export membrane protein